MKKKTKLLLVEILSLIVICGLYSNIAIGIFWTLFHEIGHIMMCRKYKIEIFGIRIHLIGLKAEVHDLEELDDIKKIKMYLAGPIINLFFIILLSIINKYLDMPIIKESIIINWGLFIFNMLPCYPLDGIRVYEILMAKKMLYIRAKNILVNLSFVIASILILLFVITVYIHNINVSLLLAAIFIIYSTFSERSKTMYILMGNIYKKRLGLIRNEYVENKNISVFYKSRLVKAMGLLDKNKYNYFFVLDDGFKLLGIIHEEELIIALKEYGNIEINEYLNIKKNKT